MPISMTRSSEWGQQNPKIQRCMCENVSGFFDLYAYVKHMLIIEIELTQTADKLPYDKHLYFGNTGVSQKAYGWQ